MTLSPPPPLKPSLDPLIVHKFSHTLASLHNTLPNFPTFDPLIMPPLDDSPDLFLPLPPPPRLHEVPLAHHSSPSAKLISVRSRRLCHSFANSRPHRRSKPDDDPFLLALKVCKEEDQHRSSDRLHTHARHVVGFSRRKDESPEFQCISKVPHAQDNRSCNKTSTRSRRVQSSNLSSDWDLRPSAVNRGRKHVHAVSIQDSSESHPILTGNHSENILADGELLWRSGEILAGGKVYRALQRCRNRLRGLSLDFEEMAPSTTVMIESPKGIHTKVKRPDREQHSQSVELCGHPAKYKQVDYPELNFDAFLETACI